MEVAEVLGALGGCARRPELKKHVSRGALERALAGGQVLRHSGIYTLPDTGRGTLLARRLRGVRSHRTAAEHWGFALPPGPTRVHITIRRKAKRSNVPADVGLHYRDHAAGDLVDGVTSALCTVIDCLRDLSLPEAICVGDSALRSGKVQYDELVARAAGLRGPGAAVARARVGMLDARAANAFESCCRAILLGAGITGFQPQLTIRHKRQWVGRVDLAHRRLRIVIECDGFATHGTLDAMRADCIRHTRLVAAGWRPLRFTWDQVMFEPAWVLELVEDTIALAHGTAPAAA